MTEAAENRFSSPAAPDTLPTNMEKFADLLTASVAARARRLHPTDVAKRAAYYNAEIQRLGADRFWRPAAAHSGAQLTKNPWEKP